MNKASLLTRLYGWENQVLDKLSFKAVKWGNRFKAEFVWWQSPSSSPINGLRVQQILIFLYLKGVSVSAQVIIPKDHRLGGLNSISFSWFWGLGSLKPRCRQLQGLVRTLFPVCRQLPSPYILTWPPRVREGKKKDPMFSSSFYKHVNPIMRVPPLWPHLNLLTSHRPHLQVSCRVG